MEAIAKKPASTASKSALKPAVKKTTVAKKPAVTAKAPAKKPVAKKSASTADKAIGKEAKVEKTTPEITSEPVVVTAPIFKPVAGKNFYGVGRRKTSVAQVLMTSGDGVHTINKIAFEKYFTSPELRHIAVSPFVAVGLEKYMSFKAKLSGGGIHSQAEALRHGITRAILLMNPESRTVLKKLGYLTRDPRVKERKKPGLHRARRAPQFSKR